jgi:hypothetical protein
VTAGGPSRPTGGRPLAGRVGGQAGNYEGAEGPSS